MKSTTDLLITESPLYIKIQVPTKTTSLVHSCETIFVVTTEQSNSSMIDNLQQNSYENFFHLFTESFFHVVIVMFSCFFIFTSLFYIYASFYVHRAFPYSHVATYGQCKNPHLKSQVHL